MTELERLQARIKHLAIEIAPDYPNIKTCDVYEHLWAIQSTCQGTQQANEDWQAFGQQVRIRYGLDNKTLEELFPSNLT